MALAGIRQRLALLRTAFSLTRRETTPTNEVTGPNNAGHESLSKELELVRDEMRVRWRQEDEIFQFLALRARVEVQAERQERDQTPAAKSALAAARESSNYSSAWQDDNPLVSVRIASYRNTESLVEVAIPSVLNQTHTNLELVIVNDGQNLRTRTAIAAIKDSRIRYVELPERSAYPPDPQLRWMVAGSPGMNKGAELATGSWIAPLDDDDEFTPDHIEKLLTLARSSRAEFVYGAITQNRVLSGEQVQLFSDPPRAGEISMQAAIYHSALRFFSYDTESWRSHEPGDWNLIRRMMDAGVRMAATSDTVTKVHMLPFSAKDTDR